MGSSLAPTLAVFAIVFATGSAFSFRAEGSSRPLTRLYQGDGTGGWGIGSSREMSPEEFSSGDRAYFDGYQMQERGDFMRQINDDKESLRRAELEELLGVAKQAGIDMDELRARSTRFDLDDDDDFLDVSVED